MGNRQTTDLVKATPGVFNVIAVEFLIIKVTRLIFFFNKVKCHCQVEKENVFVPAS